MKPLIKLAISGLALSAVLVAILNAPRYEDVMRQLWGLNQLHVFEFRQKLKARVLPAVDERFVFATSDVVLAAPSASVDGGYCPGPVAVRLTHPEPGAVVYFTRDGSIPTRRGPSYRDPIEIDSTTVLRFRAFEEGLLPSETVTRTYLIGAGFSLPVVSLVADPVALWNRHSGIYAHPHGRGAKWERSGHVEYFDREGRVSFPASVKLHGGKVNRVSPKKAFHVRYRPDSVASDHPGNLLTAATPDTERIVILRPALTNLTARLGDELFTALYREAGGFSAESIPVLVLLNGTMWGHYGIYERINAEYLKRRFGDGEYALIEGERFALAGGDSAWVETIGFFASTSLAGGEVLGGVTDRIDVENMIDYWLFNIYAGNYDWPHNNSFAFKRLDDPGSRWRWIAWDNDFAFREDVLDKNTLAWATRNEPRSDLFASPVARDKKTDFYETLIIRRLLEVEAVRNYFVSRFCDLLNTSLRPDHVAAVLDSIIAVRSPDLDTEWARWPGSLERFQQGEQTVRKFIEKRPDIILGYFRERFDVGRLRAIVLRVEPKEAGDVRVNTVVAGENPWTGRYFEGLPVILTATPAEGFAFVRWSEPAWGREATVRVSLDRDVNITATFERRGDRR